MREGSSPVCSSWLAQPASYTAGVASPTIRTLLIDHPSKQCSPHLLQAIGWKKFLTWGFLFSENSRLCRVDTNQDSGRQDLPIHSVYLNLFYSTTLSWKGVWISLWFGFCQSDLESISSTVCLFGFVSSCCLISSSWFSIHIYGDIIYIRL